MPPARRGVRLALDWPLEDRMNADTPMLESPNTPSDSDSFWTIFLRSPISVGEPIAFEMHKGEARLHFEGSDQTFADRNAPIRRRISA